MGTTAVTPSTSQYLPYAISAAEKYNVPPEILTGIITKESGWNPNASHTNSNGTTDYGIAQLNSRYYPEASSLSVEQQIDKAASILSDNYDRAGSWFGAVKAYNGSGQAAENYAADVFSKLGDVASIGGALANGDLKGALAAATGNGTGGAAVAQLQAQNGTTGDAGLLSWVKNFFSVNTANRVVLVIVGIVLLIVALVYLTGADKTVGDAVKIVAKGAVTA